MLTDLAEKGTLDLKDGKLVVPPLAFEQVYPKDHRDGRLWQYLLHCVLRHLATDDITVMDAEVKLVAVQTSCV